MDHVFNFENSTSSCFIKTTSFILLLYPIRNKKFFFILILRNGCIYYIYIYKTFTYCSYSWLASSFHHSWRFFKETVLNSTLYLWKQRFKIEQAILKKWKRKLCEGRTRPLYTCFKHVQILKTIFKLQENTFYLLACFSLAPLSHFLSAFFFPEDFRVLTFDK